MICSGRVLLGALSLVALALAAPPTKPNRNIVQPRLEQLTLFPDFEITDKPTTRTYDFTVSMQEGAPDGLYRKMLVVNGQYPGPTIEANEGDTIIVNVKNKIPKLGTSLHWHGLFQNGTQWMDGPAGVTQCPIPSGGSFTYKFKVEGQFGTFWWHAHAGAQLSDGVHGPLIIHSVRDPLKRGVHYDYDQIFIMGDWYHNTSAEIVQALDTPEGYQGSQAAPPPKSAMFNGYGTWDCEKFGTPGTCFTREPYQFEVYPNKKYRIRLINTAGHAMIFNSVDEHTLDVIEADDTGISNPSANGLHRVKSHNGQRYSVILNTDKGKPGDVFWMRAEVNPNCLPYLTPDFTNTTLAVLRYVDEKPGYKPTKSLPTTKDWQDVLGPECRDIDSATLTPILKQDVPDEVNQVGLFNTNFARVNISTGVETFRFFFNNVSFEHLWYRPVLYDVIEGRGVNDSNLAHLTFNKPEGADIIINNLDPIEHPYHLHGMSFWIVAEGSGNITMEDYKNLDINSDNPLRRDTHVIPKKSWAVFRVVADLPGVWFIHCHIDWHLSHGFAAVVVVQPDVVRKFQVPQSSKDLCKHIPPGLNVNSTELGRRQIEDGRYSRRLLP